MTPVNFIFISFLTEASFKEKKCSPKSSFHGGDSRCILHLYSDRTDMIIRHYFLNNELPYGKAQKAGKGEGWVRVSIAVPNIQWGSNPTVGYEKLYLYP